VPVAPVDGDRLLDRVGELADEAHPVEAAPGDVRHVVAIPPEPVAVHATRVTPISDASRVRRSTRRGTALPDGAATLDQRVQIAQPAQRAVRDRPLLQGQVRGGPSEPAPFGSRFLRVWDMGDQLASSGRALVDVSPRNVPGRQELRATASFATGRTHASRSRSKRLGMAWDFGQRSTWPIGVPWAVHSAATTRSSPLDADDCRAVQEASCGLTGSRVSGASP
jgi:hypothetical protein